MPTTPACSGSPAGTRAIYALTGTGHALAEASAPLVAWTAANLSQLDEARRRLDAGR